MDLPCGTGYMVDGPSPSSSAEGSASCHEGFYSHHEAGIFCMKRAFSWGSVQQRFWTRSMKSAASYLLYLLILLLILVNYIF